MTDERYINCFFVGLLIGFLLCLGIFLTFCEPHSTLIKHGVGEYNQTTGDWQYKTNGVVQ